MPKHLLLYRCFGWQPPKFAHLPLLRNPDRSKISKRKNPAARLLWFKEEGFLPEAVVNFLALQGWSMPDGREIFGFDDIVGQLRRRALQPGRSRLRHRQARLDERQVHPGAVRRRASRARPAVPAGPWSGRRAAHPRARI